MFLFGDAATAAGWGDQMGNWGHGKAVVLFALLVSALLAGYLAKAHWAAAEAPTTIAEHPAPAAPAPQPAAQAGQTASATITAVVPPQTFVRLDSHGQPAEAMTNTGHPPAAGDHFFVKGDGAARPADPATVAAILDGRPGGDWTESGRWHALQD